MKNARWGSFIPLGCNSIKKRTLSLDYFKGFTYFLNGCFQALVYSELLLQILLVRKQPLEIMIKSRKISYDGRSLFLNLIMLNASKCHLLKIDSIRSFSRILSKFYIIHYDLLEFSEHLFYRTPLEFVLEALVFQNTSKWLMLSSLSNCAIFFSKYFYLKSHRKKHLP